MLFSRVALIYVCFPELNGVAQIKTDLHWRNFHFPLPLSSWQPCCYSTSVSFTILNSQRGKTIPCMQVYLYHLQISIFQVDHYFSSQFLHLRTCADDSPPLAVHIEPLALRKLRSTEDIFNLNIILITSCPVTQVCGLFSNQCSGI